MSLKIFIVLTLFLGLFISPAILQAPTSLSLATTYGVGSVGNASLTSVQEPSYMQNMTSTSPAGSGNIVTGSGNGITNITTEAETPQSLGQVSQNSHQYKALKLEQNKKPVPLIWLASHSLSSDMKARIALVVPVFTAAAYEHAFYLFYKHYATARTGENITHDISLLSSKITRPKAWVSSVIESSAYTMLFLEKHLALLAPKSNVSVLTDIDIDGGLIFAGAKNTTNKYDILILGHQEYVTQQEYSNLKTFVANGGTLVLLDGNVFYAQVGYDRATQTITLVKGHGWAFNGRSAWKSVGERWANETSTWAGSNYLCAACKMTFVENPFGYDHREEAYISNANDTILLNYNASRSSLDPKFTANVSSAHLYTIAAYELNYKKGRVIGLGIYSDQIIDRRNFLVFLDHLLLTAWSSKF